MIHLSRRVALSLSLAFVSQNCFAIDLIANFFNPPMVKLENGEYKCAGTAIRSDRSFLAVDTLNPSSDPVGVANTVCKELGFVKGADSTKVSAYDISLETMSIERDTVIDFKRNGFKPIALRTFAQRNSEAEPKMIKLFTELECQDNPPTVKSPSSIPGGACSASSSSLQAESAHVVSLAKESMEAARKTQMEEENKIFDKVKQSPETVLLDQYDKSYLLFLGKSTHSNYQIYEYLEQLLQKRGSDPNLKVIVLERSHLTEEFFKAASTQEIDVNLVTKYLTTDVHRFSVLDPGRQTDPYVLTRFLAAIRKINQTRPENPIKVMAVDSVPGPENCPSIPLALNDHSFYTNNQFTFYCSLNREKGTQKNFTQSVLDKLGKDDKAIVVYHLGHLAQNIEARFPEINEQKGVWQAPQWHPSNWLGLLFKEKPALRERAKIVLFDEKAQDDIPDGTFNFSARHSSAAFGVPLEPLKGKTIERGIELFQASSSFRNNGYQANMVRTSAELSDLGDALIFTPDAEQKKDMQKDKVLEEAASVIGPSLGLDQETIKQAFNRKGTPTDGSQEDPK